MDIETKFLDRDFEIKEITDDGEFEGHGSVFGDLDGFNDIVAPGAFTKTLEDSKKAGRMPALLWQHNTMHPLGSWLEVKEDKRGLFVRGKLLVESVQLAKEAHALLKAKAISGLSIGYKTIKSRTEEKSGARILTEVKLFEISLCTFPALESARVTEVKSVPPFADLPLGDADKPWIRYRAERRVRSWADAEDAPNARYRRAFVWYDNEDPEKFDSYKLQISDVDDGHLVVMPRAIRVAAGVLMGASGGTDIPTDVQACARRHLGRYYDKMAEEFGDESIVPPWKKDYSYRDVLATEAAHIDTKRDFEELLRDLGFPNKAAVALASGGFTTVIPEGDPPGRLSDDWLEAQIALRAGVITSIRGG